MVIGKAVLLGLLQGLTEFLPVSSSGHLVLAQNLLGLAEPEILFDVVLHLGTLIAVLIVFRREIKGLIEEFFWAVAHLRSGPAIRDAWRERVRFRLIGLIVIGSVPTGLMGLLFKDFFEAMFASVIGVGVALLITGFFLFLTRFSQPPARSVKAFRVSDALLIGLAQGLAITPGISRSGATISTGLFLGLERELAARYSFLMFIPAILGALVLELRHAQPGAFGWLEMGVGFLTALLAGLLALMVLLKMVRGGRLHYFAYYCGPVGLVTLAASFWR